MGDSAVDRLRSIPMFAHPGEAALDLIEQMASEQEAEPRIAVARLPVPARRLADTVAG